MGKQTLTIELPPQELTPKIQPILLDAVNAAETLGIGRTLLYALVDKGLIKRIKVAGRTLFPVSELHEFVNNQIRDQYDSNNGAVE